MVTQSLPAIRSPLLHYQRRTQPSLTPPYHNDPKPDSPWSSQGGQGSSGDNYSMSILLAGEPRSEQNTPQMPPIQSYPPVQPPYRNSRKALVNPPISLPPLFSLSKTPPTPSDRRSGYPSGVYSILDPRAELVEQQRALRRNNSQMNPPSPVDTQNSQGQYGQMRRHTPTHDSRQGSVSMERERNSMIAMVPSNQSSVQLMTIQNQDGSLHNIQVETQTASKGADEKRRRNAGASARFRARRKEKEREASMSISRLEQNVRDSNEVAEYYRSERDYWRSIAMQAQPERHITRPPSPRLRRVSVAPSRAPSSTAGHGSEASYDGYEEDMREEERNVRRRTSSYHQAIGPHHPDVSTLSHESRGYPALTFRPVDSHDQQAQFAGAQPTAKRPAYRNSFPPEANRYEHCS